MPMKRYKPEQIVTMLRQIEVSIANAPLQACKEAEITRLVSRPTFACFSDCSFGFSFLDRYQPEWNVTPRRPECLKIVRPIFSSSGARANAPMLHQSNS